MTNKLLRLDKILLERKLVANKEEAHEYINAGRVVVNGLLVQNTNSCYKRDISVKIDKNERKWVSRGAYKLLRGLDFFKISVRDKICLDIGASTGGFTDVLLSRNAAKVYAVDVGYGQLAWKLRTNNKVVVMDRTNARFLTNEKLEEGNVDIIVSDASFISMKVLLPVLEKLLKNDGTMIVLIKPQFEISKEKIGNGVINDPKLHVEVLDDMLAFTTTQTKLTLINATFSPIRGPEGNIEFLFQYGLDNNPRLDKDFILNSTKLVEDAHLMTARKVEGGHD
ncbi:MAG: TlyA family RNA methyltransferase [Synergistaceae bacterium]